MQVNQPQGGAAEAITPAADLRLVSVEQLKKIHRDLDACQKVIWLAGVRPRGYGFDPSYVTDAQERLKEIETLIAATSVGQDVAGLVEALERTRATIEGQLTIIEHRATDKYLNKGPVVRSLKAHQARCAEALAAFRSKQGGAA